MSISKSFHLRWNNHLTNLRTLLEYLYNEQYFVDVTLSCQDGLLRAHRLVLSACSPYFDTIFRENPCKHPTVILKGITLRDMQSIIEYMYVGSVDIAEDDLSSLLEAANELHVKGLVQQPTESENGEQTTTLTTSEYTSRILATAKNMQEQMINPDGSLSENCPVMTLNGFMKTEIKTEIDNGSKPEMLIGNDEMTNEMFKINQIKGESDNIDIEEVMMEEEEDGQNHTFEQATIPQVQIVNEDVYCKLCNRTFISKQNMKRHMQTHSGEKPHRCEYCNLSFLRLSHLQRHHRVHTGERPFGCSQCDKHFSRSDKLKQHVIQHHSNNITVPKQQKQRGRPRKADNDALMKFYMKAPMIDTKNGHGGMGNTDHDHDIASPPSLQALQQVYNIQTSMGNNISIIQ